MAVAVVAILVIRGTSANKFLIHGNSAFSSAPMTPLARPSEENVPLERQTRDIRPGASCPVCKFVLLSRHREGGREMERESTAEGKREGKRVEQTWTHVNGHLRYPP